MSYTEYAEIVDTVETPDGMTYRALIVQDQDAQEPENAGGCPIVQIASNYYRDTVAEMTGYGVCAEYDDGIATAPRFDNAAEVIAYFAHQLGDKRTAIDTFERYLRIYHDGNLVEYGPNQGTDYTYVAYVTRTLWESWGNTGEVGKADLDEWRAYVEGDTYGIMVEYRPTVEVDDDRTGYGIEPDHDGWTETDVTCWGFYGQKYAEESAREELASEVKFHNADDKAATLFQL